ncbi:hypothetical protein At1g04090-like [Cornus florida]|uniref:hypothetical protein At1g04090-like n=1 Tax=Cornus florida TaxID=4283 RepID=UPI0028966333|nr:hypothetical protein At1g04090-like [Cornus florida]
MGNCLTSVSKSKPLPIETLFKLPSSLPTWPPGEGFASGTIDLGGLQVCQISSFTKIWATHEGGPDGRGATFFEPSTVPEGFFMLGYYSQPNNLPLFGWVLAGKDVTADPSNGALKQPIGYTLVWSSESSKINQDGNGYIWLPTPPDGYKAVGHVVTNSPEKPSLDKIRCVRSDLTDVCETEAWIWGLGKEVNTNGFNIFSSRPTNRGTQALGVSTNTFIAQNGGDALSIACLKNVKANLSSMPNLSQIQALFQAYSPFIYFHPDEKYLPASVSWFFTNGALLYKKGEESKPVPIEPTGSNLPQGGSNDGAYWLDLPVDEAAKQQIKKGDLQDAGVYLHVKPMLGATFTDIAIWVWYPFNGPARVKVGPINISLDKIGQHVGDWEHVTLRVSNFNGELEGVYFSQHSGGQWVSASELEFQNGNKVVTYASLHGHAFYPKAGLVLQGNGSIGIRNDTAKSKMVMDSEARFVVVAADYLGSTIVEPPWLNYAREWGPTVGYDIEEEIKKVEKLLPGKLKTTFEKFVKGLPKEVLGEEGPTGPKMKNNWSGDEKV